MMNITDLRVRLADSEKNTKLKAYVSVTFDDAFVVHNIKVIDGENGTFIAMPSRKTNSGEHKDVAHPITTDFRATLQDAVLDEYAKVAASA